MDGANEAGVSRLVRDRRSDLRHQIGQIGLQDVGVGPETSLELRLGHDPGPLLQERLEQLKGLGRQVDRLARPPELSRLRVQQAFAEKEPHLSALLGYGMRSPGSLALARCLDYRADGAGREGRGEAPGWVRPGERWRPPGASRL